MRSCSWSWLVLAVVVAAASGCGDDEVQRTPTIGTASDGSVSSDLVFGDGGAATEGGASAADAAEQNDAVAPVSDAQQEGGPADGAASTCPGAVGCACFTEANCPVLSGCVPTAAGSVCAAPCLSGQPCPPDSACVTLPGADTVSTDDDKTVCAPKWPHLCDPCTTATTCGLAASKAGSCAGADVDAGSKGFFCSSGCSDDSNCSASHQCGAGTDSDGVKGLFCLPKSGVCTCSDTAITKGLVTSCASATTLADGTVISCVGVRTCTAATGMLSACSATVPKTEVCNGLDDDCNGSIDEFINCDDDNPCTTDLCAKGSCEYQPNAIACTDGNPCTAGDHCATGTCTAGPPLVCDDKNICTTDTCNPVSGCAFANNAMPCDDGDACTENETCAGGSCKTGTVSCPCQNDSDCGKNEDGNLCNGTLYCAKGQMPFVCKVNPATIVTCNPKDDTVCAMATCDGKSGKCKAVAQGDGEPCNDGSACTQNDACKVGLCSGGALPCDDANACTDDACDAKAGCTHKTNAAVCSDGDLCTLGDNCVASVCKATPKGCDDGFACSVDSCDKATGGCKNAAGGDAKCGVSALTYAHNFDCGLQGLDMWQKSDWALPVGAVKWGFDATPQLPSATTPTCSLNINNGKDLACATGQAAVAASADSPWLNATALPAGATLTVRFASAGNWTVQQAAKVQVRVVAAEWTDVGSVAPAAAATILEFSLKGYGGKTFQVRLVFAGPCAAGAIGWFVDDFAVFEDKCASNNGGCLNGQICSMDALLQVTCSPCKGGFAVKDGKCADIDECAQANTCASDATCANLAGSFACTCKGGYLGDGKICKDIDECVAGTANCGANAVCANSAGSFTCKCGPNTVGDGKSCFKKGFDAKVPAASCLEIWTLYPGTADGSFWLDLDGAGSQLPSQYACDMKNGGWTLLIFDDFEDGSTKGWANGKAGSCGDLGKMLGGPGIFGSGAVTTKTVAAPAHTQAKLFMHYIKGDQWDGETGIVQVNGNTVFSQKGISGVFGNKCGDWLWDEDKWDANWTGGHTAATVIVTATSTLNQSADNEWFAIDNVVLWVK
ncbi:MAG: hypothetical protein EXR77_16380 [Myxococcales bacterium]|nr:hypothetical protein [Myxococcales bacterium]